MELKDILNKTDLDEKLKEKTGIDLNDLDTKKVDEIKALILKNKDKVDLEAIAKKAGVPENIVKTVLEKLK